MVNPLYSIGFRNLKRRALRAIITMSSVILAIACFVVIVSIKDTEKQGVLAGMSVSNETQYNAPYYSHFIVTEGNKWIWQNIRIAQVDEDLVKSLEDEKGVAYVAPHVGSLSNDESIQLDAGLTTDSIMLIKEGSDDREELGGTTDYLSLQGIDPNREINLWPIDDSVVEGSWQEFASGGKTSDGNLKGVLGVNYSLRNDIEIGDTILLKRGLASSRGGEIHDDTYIDVVAIIDPEEKITNSSPYYPIDNLGSKFEPGDMLFLNLDDAQDVLNSEGKVTEIAIVFNTTLDRDTRYQSALDVAQKILNERSLNMKIIDPNTEATAVKVTNVSHLQTVIIALIVAAIVAMNASIMSIFERIREVGIMTSSGAQKFHVQDMFLVETIFVGFLSGILGYLFGNFLALSTHFLSNYSLFGFSVPYIALKLNPIWLFASLAIGVLACGLTALIPARLAANLDPIKAIAGEWAMSKDEGKLFGKLSNAFKGRYYLSLAARNLGKRKTRTFLTTLGIVVGLAMFSSLTVVALGVQPQIEDEVGTVVQDYQYAVAFFALIVGMLGITNAMLTSILERTKEIGIMVAIGATPKEVRKVFITEAILIGLIGGIFGSIIGLIIGIIPYMSGIGISLTKLILPSIFVFFITIAISVIISIAAAIYPAKRASKMNPVEAFVYDW